VQAVAADVVLVASPPTTHLRLAEEALAAGCHVIVEKPLALSMEDGRAIEAAAGRAGRFAVVAQNYRFRRAPRGLRELVRRRELGRLVGIKIACRRDLRDAWVSPRDWRGRMRHPYVIDMAIHHVDMLRMVTGREVARVDARGWGAPDGPFRHDASVAALLELDDGTPVAYEGTWTEARNETSWNGEWELIGAAGRATWSGPVNASLRGNVRLARTGEPFERVALPRLRAVDRTAILVEVRTAVDSGRVPETAATDNLRSLAATLALARSTDERRPVDVAELLES
jgi:predicted dehydrogenase